MSDIQYDVPAEVHIPAPPASESVGPPLTPLVVETRRALEEMRELTRQWVRQSRELHHYQTVTGETDGSGNIALELFQVPSGMRGHIAALAVEEASFTPANPDTGTELWLAIYRSGAGVRTAAQVALMGGLLDCSPLTPAAAAQIPYVFWYPSGASGPSIFGPEAFYLVIEGAQASHQIAARVNVVTCQLEL